VATRRVPILSILAIAFTVLVALPAEADAQRRGPRGRSHAGIIVSSGFGYPGIWFYDQWGPYGPYGPWGPYRPYPRYLVNDFSAALKFDVEPKDAEVYVNGALAGQIDDFDGIFQSLRLRPGEHEIVVYRNGFRSAREQVYLEPFRERKLRFDLEPLAAGEAQEPRPQGPPPGMDPRERGREMPEPPRRPEPRQAPPRPSQPAQFGTLSLRVVPADAEVFVDGERWSGPAGPVPADLRLSIQLAPGRHKIEVRKQGLQTYIEEVLIRQGATLTLNVSLK
jgi:hypothetical protein